MADALADWSTDSNTAVNISLVQPSAEAGVSTVTALHTFNPKWTYPIFGEEERIFGYNGLKINLKFNSSDMRPGLQITYTKKFKAVGDTEPTDLKAALEEFLPKAAFEKTSVFEAAISDPSLADLTPPGELWQSLEVKNQKYEIWKGCLADLAVRQMIKRLQILVPLFIEGGTLLLPPGQDEDEETLKRWTAFFLYKKNAAAIDSNVSPYNFMGYCTVYRYYLPTGSVERTQNSTGKPAEPSNTEMLSTELALSSFPCRSRISQFVILPPFQGGGFGSRLYKSIFEFYYKEKQTVEITLEDPNEAFDDMRDINDLAFLRTIPEFTSIRINTKASIPRGKRPSPNDIVNLESLEKFRLKVKIAPRQFYRLVEMQLLSLIPTDIRQSLILERPKGPVADRKAKEHEYHLWQILVKKRLYRHNKQALAQLDRTERIDKVDQALGAVEADYARLLLSFDERSKPKARATNGKRPRTKPRSLDAPIEEDFEEDEEADEPSSKKVKFT
ncbi:acyl-CoA N-acyltransferase [Bisporella sp. PMI_857]|nr:acyl-CoA N-acyltransferase [Bisporella sp. PMI_857]